MKKVRVAVVGLGQRGYYVTKLILLNNNKIEITALCDLYEDRVEEAAKLLTDKGLEKPFGSVNYVDILERDDVDAVYVACSWEYHIEVAIEAMKRGKAVALEVGGAYSLEELDELVRTYEETKTPLMFMENCCFNREELLATSVARSGKLGRVVHCSGAYAHDLRDEITKGNIIRHYRLRNYTNRNCENYPTHELGPIAKLLNINRGNRMVSLVSMASVSGAGLEQYVKDHPELVEQDPTLEGRRFKQGDIVHTIITCAGGETILLKLDTTLPRAYSREFTVRGTKGYYSMDTNAVYLDGMSHGSLDAAENVKAVLNNAKEYEADYLHPVWLNMTKEDMENGHGGMDAVLWNYFVDAFLEGKEMPIDVYDAASWMAITALSERSIAMGGAPQSIPDYTDGKWILREPKDVVDLSECAVNKK
ncbi:MAG: Gfo/Idh/MocA family oxidoreductase [Clostridia bacterium]|nr:Gfo/Idh/MocA family oxidoreductase [Clostridia bacterium]